MERAVRIEVPARGYAGVAALPPRGMDRLSDVTLRYLSYCTIQNRSMSFKFVRNKCVLWQYCILKIATGTQLHTGNPITLQAFLSWNLVRESSTGVIKAVFPLCVSLQGTGKSYFKKKICLIMINEALQNTQGLVYHTH